MFLFKDYKANPNIIIINISKERRTFCPHLRLPQKLFSWIVYIFNAAGNTFKHIKKIWDQNLTPDHFAMLWHCAPGTAKLKKDKKWKMPNRWKIYLFLLKDGFLRCQSGQLHPVTLFTLFFQTQLSSASIKVSRKCSSQEHIYWLLLHLSHSYDRKTCYFTSCIIKRNASIMMHLWLSTFSQVSYISSICFRALPCVIYLEGVCM